MRRRGVESFLGYVFYFELQTVDTAENGIESSIGNGQRLQNKNVSVERSEISVQIKRFQPGNARNGNMRIENI